MHGLRRSRRPDCARRRRWRSTWRCGLHLHWRRRYGTRRYRSDGWRSRSGRRRHGSRHYRPYRLNRKHELRRRSRYWFRCYWKWSLGNWSCGGGLGFHHRRHSYRASRRRRGSLLFAQQIQHIARLGNVREIDLGLDFIGIGAAGARGLTCSLRFVGLAEVGADLLRVVLFERAGVGFLLSDSGLDQHIKNSLTLDFQFPGQIVDSNLAHPPFLPSGLSR